MDLILFSSIIFVLLKKVFGEKTNDDTEIKMEKATFEQLTEQNKAVYRQQNSVL